MQGRMGGRASWSTAFNCSYTRGSTLAQAALLQMHLSCPPLPKSLEEHRAFSQPKSWGGSHHLAAPASAPRSRC